MAGPPMAKAYSGDGPNLAGRCHHSTGRNTNKVFSNNKIKTGTISQLTSLFARFPSVSRAFLSGLVDAA